MTLLRSVLLTLAIAAAPVTAAHAGDSGSAGQYIQKIGDQALATISNGKLSKAQKQSRLDVIFSGNVDIPWVGRFVMGRAWRDATEAQKARYLKEYQRFLIKHYTSRFADYTSGTFNITGTKTDGDAEYTVSMELIGNNKNDEPVLVDYRVRKGDGGFKIFDVIVEGVSLITTQRSEFSSVINQHGIDYLINQLANRSMPDSAASTASR